MSVPSASPSPGPSASTGTEGHNGIAIRRTSAAPASSSSSSSSPSPFLSLPSPSPRPLGSPSTEEVQSRTTSSSVCIPGIDSGVKQINSFMGSRQWALSSAHREEPPQQPRQSLLTVVNDTRLRVFSVGSDAAMLAAEVENEDEQSIPLVEERNDNGKDKELVAIHSVIPGPNDTPIPELDPDYKKIVMGPWYEWCILSLEFGEIFNKAAYNTVLFLYLSLGLEWSVTLSIMGCSAFAGVRFAMPLLGGFISDSYLAKRKTASGAAILYCVGVLGLVLAGFLSSTGLCICALFLLSLGTGGIKPCTSSLACDQFTAPSLQPPWPRAKRLAAVNSYVSVFYMVANGASIVCQLSVPFVRRSASSSLGYQAGSAFAFVIPAAMMMIGTAVFLYGGRFFYVKPPAGSLLKPIGKLFGWGIKYHWRQWRASHGGYQVESLNTKLTSDLSPRNTNASQRTKMHFLDYLTVNVGTDSLPPSIQSVCTLTNIEYCRTLLRVWPIYSAYIVFWCLRDVSASIWIQSAIDMQTYGMPPELIMVIYPICIVVFLPILKSYVYPCLGPRFNVFRKMQLGFLLTGVSFTCSFFVETAVESGAPNSVSVFLIIPQLVILVLGDLLVTPTGLEFGTNVSPPVLKSIITANFYLPMSLGNFLTLILVGSFRNLVGPKWLILIFIGCMVLNIALFSWHIHHLVAEDFIYKTPKPPTAIGTNRKSLISMSLHPMGLSELPRRQSLQTVDTTVGVEVKEGDVNPRLSTSSRSSTTSSVGLRAPVLSHMRKMNRGRRGTNRSSRVSIQSNLSPVLEARKSLEVSSISASLVVNPLQIAMAAGVVDMSNHEK